MKKNRAVELILLFTIFIWGINTPIMKIGLIYLSPIVYNALRLVVAAMAACLVLAFSKTYRPMPAEDRKRVLLISLLGFFVFQALFTSGLPLTTAGNASLVLALLPLSVAAINRLYNIEPISRQVAAGIGICLAGVVIIVLGSGKEISLAGAHLLGALLIMLGQIGNGYYTVFSKQLSAYSHYQIIACVMTICAIAFCLIALPGFRVLDWAGIPAAAWYSIVFSGTFALCFGNFTWVWAVGILGSTKAALFQNLSPVFTIITAWFFLGETFGLIQCLGAGVIFFGLYLTRQKSAKNADGNPCGSEIA